MQKERRNNDNRPGGRSHRVYRKCWAIVLYISGFFFFLNEARLIFTSPVDNTGAPASDRKRATRLSNEPSSLEFPNRAEPAVQRRLSCMGEPASDSRLIGSESFWAECRQ